MINQGSSLDRALHHDDMNAARELMEEIDQRGLFYEYVYALFREIDSSATNLHVGREWNVPQLGVWRMLNATPKQHARAFIAATQSP